MSYDVEKSYVKALEKTIMALRKKNDELSAIVKANKEFKLKERIKQLESMVHMEEWKFTTIKEVK